MFGGGRVLAQFGPKEMCPQPPNHCWPGEKQLQGGRAGDQELKVEQIPPSEQLLPAARAPGSSRVRFKTDRGRKCTVKVGAARMPPVAAEKNHLFKGQV